MIEVIQDEGSIGGHGGADALELFNSRVHGVLTPVLQEPLSLDSRLHLPKQPELFLHGMHGHEGLIDFEQAVQALAFFPLEVFVIGEEEEAGALEGFMSELIALSLKLAAEFVHRPVDEGDEVIVIEDDGDAGQMFFDGGDVSVAEVHGHGLEIGGAAAEGFEEGDDAVSALAGGGVEDSSALEVNDDGHVNVSFADAEFINGDVADVLESDVAVFSLEGAAVDVLDEVPSGPEEVGAGGDGGEAEDFEDHSFEGTGVGSPGIGEGEMGPCQGAAVSALEAMDEQKEPDLAGADRGESKVADFAALVSGVWAFALGTDGELPAHFGMNPDFAGDGLGFTILDMFDSEGMIEDRGGHGLTPWLVGLPSVLSCPPFFKCGHLSLNRMNQFYNH